MPARRHLGVTKLTQDWHDYVLIRDSDQGDAPGMATQARKINAERRMRKLLEDAHLPQPDYVEYGFTCIRLFFNATKTVVVIDIDESEGMESSVDGDAA